jgi:hypothetical protein
MKATTTGAIVLAVALAALATFAADLVPLTPSQFHARPERGGEPVTLTGMLTYGTLGWRLAEDAKAYGTETHLAGIVPRLVQLGHRLPSINHKSIGEGAIVVLQGTTIDTGCTRRRCIEIPPEVNVLSLRVTGYGDRFACRRSDEAQIAAPAVPRNDPEWVALEQLAQRIVNAVRAHDGNALKAMFVPEARQPKLIDELAAPGGDFDWVFFDPQYSFSAYPAKEVPHAFLRSLGTEKFAYVCFARNDKFRDWPNDETQLNHANITDPFVCYYLEKSRNGWGLNSSVLTDN